MSEQKYMTCPKCKTLALEIIVDLINGRRFGEAHLHCRLCGWNETLPLKINVLRNVLTC